MSLFVKDRWKTWATSWGLNHYAQRGPFYRNEQVAGLRNGYLVLAGWTGQKNMSLMVRVRFPGGADLEGIRRALVADSTLDSLPGKGKGRAKTVLEMGPEKQTRLGTPTNLSRIPEFTLRDGSLIWIRHFSWSAPRPEQVMSWVDTLLKAVARTTQPFDGRCEQCHSTQVRQFVFVDHVPRLLCGTCQERLRAEAQMAERNYDMIEARHLNGALLALAAAVLGAIVWGAVAGLTGRILVAAAIGIGALVAFAYRRGAGRVDLAGQVIGAVLTVASVVMGQVLYYAWGLSQVRHDVGFSLSAGWYVYQRAWATDPGLEGIALFFGLIGALVAFGMIKRRPQGAIIRQADEDPRDALRKAA